MTEMGLNKRITKGKKSSTIKDVIGNKWLYIFVIPGVIWFLIFCYQPMYGILIAFKRYEIHKGVFASEWVGLKYFYEFFRDPNFKVIMTNTLGISVLKMIFGFPMPIILALLLNEVKNKTYKKVTQTISYLPFFISWVVAFGIWHDFLSIDGGILNNILISLGFIKEPIFWFGRPQYFWGIIVASDVWKNVGFGTIIYLAAISGINPETYESAVIDGASKIRMIWHITLPFIRPTILMLFILGMGGILNAGFDQVFVMSNAAVASKALIIDVYVVNRGIFAANYEIATAIGLFKSIIGVILLLTVNYTVKRFGEEGIL